MTGNGKPEGGRARGRGGNDCICVVEPCQMLHRGACLVRYGTTGA